MDTIVAPICGTNGSVQVLRISGKQTREVLEKIINSPASLFANSHKLFLKKIINPISGEPIDQGLVVFFKAPRSYTGEDCAELNLHASSYIVNEVLAQLTELGLRAAQPGEFTKRAFLNGQIDLLQAEAVADLIASQTAAQARIARQQLSGRLSNTVDEIGEPLRDLLAIIEAHIDFPEEGIEVQTTKAWASALELVKNKIEQLLATYKTGRIAREGAQVVLAGIPNAGKSSLLNALAKEDRAIVTNIAGTTRDSIEQRINLQGFAISLWDTAGLAQARTRKIDEIESIGIEKSWKKIAQADLVLYVIDLTQNLNEQLSFLEEIRLNSPAPVLVVVNKADLLSEKSEVILELKAQVVSAKTNQAIDQLANKIVIELGLRSEQDLVLISNIRHKQAVENAQQYVLAANKLLIQDSQNIEIIALEIKSALIALTELVGVTENEDVLGRIFSKFCIGK
jgi:tRNA modification GTPase